MISDLHFMFDPKKDFDADFASSLIDGLGQASIEDSQTIVAVGGDGLLLRALRHGVSKNVFGLVSPESNSAGFWTNRGINDADELQRALCEAGQYSIKPIRANICFADGSKVNRYGYNEISVRSTDQDLLPELREEFGLSSVDLSMQSVLLKLKVHFEDAARELKPFMGRGLTFSTPLGSTAMNKYNGGPAEDIRREAIILSGMSTNDIQPINNDGDVRFSVEVQSPHKRPVVIGFDSFGVKKNAQDSPVNSVEISTAHDMTTNLMLMDDPATRAYSQLIM